LQGLGEVSFQVARPIAEPSPATQTLSYGVLFMIVGGYSLHLYCDNVTACKAISRRGYGHAAMGDFAGYDKPDCVKQAKKAGWHIRLGKCFCPDCSK